ncbi:beta-ketoacyl synthase chain length factor [Streptomyces sp. S465]|uniref:beta-ketoacyl synthase chain length factor n=1 Tax=Streptomyces sp. S465 TaxID=2979468 RepID=UPI0022A8A898|nr:beta-ketoacyl synthase chain length factor [Streptomyces sp. S465]WAP53947.1 beta-ketoacyl synthase chain length factor [Streptomyces sp. S465]
MIAAICDASAPPVAGFVESVFSPMVHQAVERCLTARPGDGSRTAMVLASTMGDATTLDLGSRRLVAGQAHNPLLFMQSTANAVLGQLSVTFAVTGPLLSLSTVADPAGELLATAELLLEDAELDRVVLIGVELTGTERTAAAHRELRTGPPAGDLAVAIVLDRGDPLRRLLTDIPSGPSAEYGALRGLVELAARVQGTNP